MVSFKKKRILKINSKKIYSLVADVKKYPDFLPWCKNVNVKKKQKNIYLLKSILAFKILKKVIFVKFCCFHIIEYL